MKKSKDRTSLKITDFFLSKNVNPIFTDFALNQNNSKDKQNSDENYLNLKEDEEKSNIFLNNYQQKSQNDNNNKYKKKKLDENKIDNNNNINKSLSYFININSNSPMDKKRKIILLDLSNNKLLSLVQINLRQNNFINPQEFNSAFPYQFCKMININNITYITGGKLNDEFSKLNYNNNIGQKKCYKMIYNKEKKEIQIDKMPSSIFEHQSHSLLYLKKFDTIVMCSGHKQKNCEYFNLKENEWKRLYNLQKPRENALALVYNEKYIFLIEGKNQERIINEDYDVIDFEIFLSNKVQNYWKTYTFKNKIRVIMMKNELWLIWKQPKTRRRYKIGTLCYKENRYFFEYTNPELEDARESGFTFFPGFENTNEIYTSNSLFANIETRLPNPSRPDYLEILNTYGLEKDSTNIPFLIFPTIEKNSSDAFEVITENIDKKLGINDNELFWILKYIFFCKYSCYKLSFFEVKYIIFNIAQFLYPTSHAKLLHDEII